MKNFKLTYLNDQPAKVFLAILRWALFIRRFGLRLDFLNSDSQQDRDLATSEIRQSKINSRSVAGRMGQMNRQPSV